MKVLASSAFAMQPPTRNVSAATPATSRSTAPASTARNGQIYANGCQGDKLVENLDAFKRLLLRLHPHLRKESNEYISSLWEYLDKMFDCPDNHAYYMSRTGEFLSPRSNIHYPIFSLRLPTLADLMAPQMSPKPGI